ncbi:MAG: DNA repair protein RecO [Candidatus Omnitrophica bacterium]|nr:DNA repair protein RecO [Candidatus Omnitrophota bacterium]
MAALKAEGIILRKYLLRETSYILVIFTREYGKIRGVLKGARNPYPQFAGNFEIFTQCELLFYGKRKKGMDLISRCEAVDFFLPVRKDIERLTYANYFIELIDAVSNDHEANTELYEIILEGLRLLATESSPRRAGRIFEIKLLDAIGLGPRLDECAGCSSSLPEDFRFSVKCGGIVCRDCAKKEGASMEISSGTRNFMRRIHDIPFTKARQVKVSKVVGREAEAILKKFIQYYIGGQMRSMKFLEDMDRTGVLRKV